MTARSLSGSVPINLGGQHDAIREGHLQLIGSAHHMVIGHDVPLGIPHEAGTLAFGHRLIV